MAPVGIMISAGLNSKNIINSVSIYNDISLMSSNSNEYYWDEKCLLRIFWG